MYTLAQKQTKSNAIYGALDYARRQNTTHSIDRPCRIKTRTLFSAA